MSFEIIDVDAPVDEELDDLPTRLTKWNQTVDSSPQLSQEENCLLRSFLEEIVSTLNQNVSLQIL
jgi:hypothetical protein